MTDPMELNSPRGTKRKAEELDHDGSIRRDRIKALDPDVVNKIAAGEIIVAPVHALKELIENAVDAGSTSLQIVIKDGGLKLLQITDNGSGIDKQDLPILCERFTTSKLQKFEDLESIATYGFRGEALASISHIAHLTITTRKKDSDCAWRAHYGGNKLIPAVPGQDATPQAVAGRQGTQIKVEDLFYNTPTRRRAFRSASDEYHKILDMVGRYAVHCSHVAFSCKKHGEPSASIAIQSGVSTIDRIRHIYGAVANELVKFSTADTRWGFKAAGLASNANYSTKRITLLLFINHRCVDSTNIRKAVEQTYAAFLPKNGHPFVYLSLEIDPRRVDVNVHPTKRQVHFLNEDEIIKSLCEHIRSKLAAVDTSRTFVTQTLLPGGIWSGSKAQANSVVPSAPAKGAAGTGDDDGNSSNNVNQIYPRKAPPRNEAKLVRTDTNMRKITSMLAPATGNISLSAADTRLDKVQYEIIDRGSKSCALHSVRELRQAVRDDTHNDLTEIFTNLTFVGIVDEKQRLAAMQSGLKLYIVDYGRVCFEYFYQLALSDFGNFGSISFHMPLDLRELLKIAVELEQSRGSPCQDLDTDEVVDRVANQLIERREMLSTYFSLEISPAGELLGIPLLIKDYMPAIVKLPQFLLRLGPKVNWTRERECFESFLKELATFYVPEQLPRLPDGKDKEQQSRQEETPDIAMDDPAGLSDDIKSRRAHVLWAVEHVLFPAFKSGLVATQKLLSGGGVLEATDLRTLYRVFERC